MLLALDTATALVTVALHDGDRVVVEHSSTVDRVAAELRRAVFDGELESGTPLREVALAGSLGVSRPTVREALTVLVAEGLATREPNRGVSVASPEAESVHDVCCARLVLEGAGIRVAPWVTLTRPALEHDRDLWLRRVRASACRCS